MLTYDEIIKYCSDYKVEKGIILDKKSNQQVADEDTILKVKSSVLIFKEARESYQSDISQFGKTAKSQEDYIKKAMERFGVSNEENSYGVNKLVNAILSSSGHYEESMSGSDLQNSKFSILVAPKSEYGLAYLKLKFREKGLDIEDFKISQDLTELQHNGISKVIIDFKVKKYEKRAQNAKQPELSNHFQHPRAKELNDLERQKQIAKQNGDEITYNSIQAAIEKIIRESPAEVTPRQWDSMSLPQQISFVKVKINESKILHDKDEFNYWNSNLKYLEARLSEQSKTQGPYQYPETAQELEKKENKNTNNNSNSGNLNLPSLISQLKSKLNRIQSEYHLMLSDGYIDDIELRVLINMISKVIDDGYSLRSLASSENDIRIISSIIETLETEQKQMNKTQIGIEKVSKTMK